MSNKAIFMLVTLSPETMHPSKHSDSLAPLWFQMLDFNLHNTYVTPL